jgi:hypothetical protein
MTPQQAFESIEPGLERILEIIEDLLAGRVSREKALELLTETSAIQTQVVIANAAIERPAQ